MMRTLRNTLASLVVAGPLLVLSSDALAGQRVNNEVSINLSGRVASGSLGGARNSSDTRQSLGCAINNFSIWCFATDRNGVSVTCSAPSAKYQEFARVIAGLNSDSNLQFAWDTAGSCLNLFSWTASYYAPKAH